MLHAKRPLGEVFVPEPRRGYYQDLPDRTVDKLADTDPHASTFYPDPDGDDKADETDVEVSIDRRWS